MAKKDLQLKDDILAHVIANPGAAPKDLEAKFSQVSKATISRYLKDLLEEGRLKVDGAGPNTRYFSTDIDDYLAISVDLRPVARFRREWVSTNLPRYTEKQIADFKALGVPAGGTAEDRARSVREQLMVDLSYGSSKLEGNTYNLIETKALLEYGQQAPGKSADEARMILNHRDAIRYMLENLKECAIDKKTVIDLHALLSEGLIAPGSAGSIRDRAVSIGQSKYRPTDVKSVLEEGLVDLLATVNAEPSPYTQSLMLTVGLAYLQPFMDCNKRTGRVIANLPLLKAGLPPVSFVAVDKVGYLSGLLGYYELGVGDRIRAVMAKAYIASASAYRNLVANPTKSPEQDAAELKYRSFIRNRLRDIVLGQIKEGAALPDSVPDSDRGGLEQILKVQLDSLHPGRAAVIGVTGRDIENYLSSRSSQHVADADYQPGPALPSP